MSTEYVALAPLLGMASDVDDDDIRYRIEGLIERSRRPLAYYGSGASCRCQPDTQLDAGVTCNLHMAENLRDAWGDSEELAEVHIALLEAGLTDRADESVAAMVRRALGLASGKRATGGAAKVRPNEGRGGVA